MNEFIKMFLDATQKSSGVMWAILALGFISLVLILERCYHYYRTKINIKDFMEGINTKVKNGNYAEVVSICDNEPGPIPRMTRDAVTKFLEGNTDIEKIFREVGLREIPKLEKNLNILATIAQIAPYLGLLGTLIGLSKCFSAIGDETFINLKNIAPFVSVAIYTTIPGLIISIITYLFYNFFVTIVQDSLKEMEKVALEISYHLKKSIQKPTEPDNTKNV